MSAQECYEELYEEARRGGLLSLFGARFQSWTFHRRRGVLAIFHRCRHLEDGIARASAGLDADSDHEEPWVGVRSGVLRRVLRGGALRRTSLFIRRQIPVVDFPPFAVVRVDRDMWWWSHRKIPMMHVLFMLDDAPDAEVHSPPKGKSCAKLLSLDLPVAHTCRVRKRVINQ